MRHSISVWHIKKTTETFNFKVIKKEPADKEEKKQPFQFHCQVYCYHTCISDLWKYIGKCQIFELLFVHTPTLSKGSATYFFQSTYKTGLKNIKFESVVLKGSD